MTHIALLGEINVNLPYPPVPLNTLPETYILMAMNNQMAAQRRPGVFNSGMDLQNGTASGNFDWTYTPEGFNFWNAITILARNNKEISDENIRVLRQHLNITNPIGSEGRPLPTAPPRHNTSAGEEFEELIR